ncbi:uncharacterized protein LOC109831211 [Asparagus officinalis]|uniref:uncharacterized protein LOC109831211 n=1 Tax=Asparagus officinalis TaxID=4686 RepID=UPI00098DF562|nr:uncharacterized protein LOC109831211 [Asparagus officinalis]
MSEKECLTLESIIQKMQHYLVGQIIYVISSVNSIRVFMTQPASMNLWLARWALLLSQYDIHFKQQKSIKGQTIFDLLAINPTKDKAELFEDLPDETTKSILPLTSRCGNCTSMALLEQLMCFTKELGVEYFEAFVDSQLIVNQVRGEYKVKNQDLIPYHQAAVEIADSFKELFIEYITRLQNAYTYALAILAVSLAQPPKTEQLVTVRTYQLFILDYALDIKEVYATGIELKSVLACRLSKSVLAIS